ncbi:MAG: hypothetical protein JWR33_2135 [Naasia sp.]|jgi:hypothetical protein|nr:hypothetical protein [Naasia sp.]
MPFSVVHLGQSAVVLKAGPSDRLLVVTGSAGGLMPDGICLPDAAFQAARARLARAQRDGARIWATEQVTHERTWSALVPTDLRITPAPLDGTAIRTMKREMGEPDRRFADARIDSMDPSAARLRSGSLAAAGIRRPGEVVPVLRRLIGAGPGTTPSGDDVIVGVLAGLAVADRRAAFEAIAAALPGLLSRTTLASRHYLTAAAAGRFGEHVHHLVAAVTGTAPTGQALERARTWGASSGLDLLTGLIAAVSEHLLAPPTMERSA